jgi:hypothetical protein
MRKMLVLIVTTTSMALPAWLAGMVAHAGQPRQKVTVYLLDRANERSMACIPAQALAGRMFAAMGVSLEWAKGKPAGESSPPPIIIEVVTGAPENFKPGSLAYALPYEGSHITVFVDRIENMRAPSNVLAHVMVHEITHILQGISRHSATGVMKQRWTPGDFSGMRFKPLPFTPLDIDLIYAGLAARATGAGVLEGNRPLPARISAGPIR